MTIFAGNGEEVTRRNPRTYDRNTASIFGLLFRYFPVGSNNFPDSFQWDPPVSGSRKHRPGYLVMSEERRVPNLSQPPQRPPQARSANPETPIRIRPDGNGGFQSTHLNENHSNIRRVPEKPESINH